MKGCRNMSKEYKNLKRILIPLIVSALFIGCNDRSTIVEEVKSYVAEEEQGDVIGEEQGDVAEKEQDDVAEEEQNDVVTTSVNNEEIQNVQVIKDEPVEMGEDEANSIEVGELFPEIVEVEEWSEYDNEVIEHLNWAESFYDNFLEYCETLPKYSPNTLEVIPENESEFMTEIANKFLAAYFSNNINDEYVGLIDNNSDFIKQTNVLLDNGSFGYSYIDYNTEYIAKKGIIVSKVDFLITEASGSYDLISYEITYEMDLLNDKIQEVYFMDTSKPEKGDYLFGDMINRIKEYEYISRYDPIFWKYEPFSDENGILTTEVYVGTEYGAYKLLRYGFIVATPYGYGFLTFVPENFIEYEYEYEYEKRYNPSDSMEYNFIIGNRITDIITLFKEYKHTIEYYDTSTSQTLFTLDEEFLITNDEKYVFSPYGLVVASTVEKKDGLVDMNGNEVLEFKFDNINLVENYNNRYEVIYEDSTYVIEITRDYDSGYTIEIIQ
jgi:hypothetical protein